MLFYAQNLSIIVENEALSHEIKTRRFQIRELFKRWRQSERYYKRINLGNSSENNFLKYILIVVMI